MKLRLLWGALLAAMCVPIVQAADHFRSPPASTQQRAEAAELARNFATLDAKLRARSGHRVWVPEVNLRAAALEASPGAKVAETVCAADFCRMDVVHANEAAARAFAANLGETDAIPAGVMFKYHAGQPLRTTTYVLRPPPSSVWSN